MGRNKNSETENPKVKIGNLYLYKISGKTEEIYDPKPGEELYKLIPYDKKQEMLI